MTKCYIGFSYPKKFKIGAFAISHWIGKPYSHAYIRFESYNLSTVYQASHGMVHFREFTNFKKDNEVVVEYIWTISPDKVKSLMYECVLLAGEKYGFLDIPSILLYDTTGLDFGDSEGYVCSSLVGKLYSEYSDYNFDKPNHLIRPDDVEKAVILYG